MAGFLVKMPFPESTDMMSSRTSLANIHHLFDFR